MLSYDDLGQRPGGWKPGYPRASFCCQIRFTSSMSAIAPPDSQPPVGSLPAASSLSCAARSRCSAALYFAQGLPFGFFTIVLPVLLREAGFSLKAISALSLLHAALGAEVSVGAFPRSSRHDGAAGC